MQSTPWHAERGGGLFIGTNVKLLTPTITILSVFKERPITAALVSAHSWINYVFKCEAGNHGNSILLHGYSERRGGGENRPRCCADRWIKPRCDSMSLFSSAHSAHVSANSLTEALPTPPNSTVSEHGDWSKLAFFTALCQTSDFSVFERMLSCFCGSG